MPFEIAARAEPGGAPPAFLQRGVEFASLVIAIGRAIQFRRRPLAIRAAWLKDEQE